MDQEAEQAIRDAFAGLTAQGTPINATTLPDAARQRLGTGLEPDRIYKAIDDMIKRGELSAPNDPMRPSVDWSLLSE